jgi:hypothetical protein
MINLKIGNAGIAGSRLFIFRILKNAGRGLTCLCLLFLTLSSFAQVQPDSKGTDFWLMFNQNLGGPQLSLFITGDIATNGTVEILGLGFSVPFSVTPGTVTTVILPTTAAASGIDSIENKGIHVFAGEEVTVYGLNRISATTDAFLGLPTDILGTEYINLGYENVNIVNATQFGLVATQDNTTVTITPTVAAGLGRAAGVPFDILLNQGQTYQLVATGSAPTDLSGSIIFADQPIAVFGGHQCANIPFGNIACDHIVEQLPPVSTWGNSFVTFPLATRVNGDTFRIMAAQNNTVVSINGIIVATLGRGEIFETVLTAASRITSDQPVLLAQYSNSTSFDGVTSDPFEVIVPPFEQFLAGYTITTPSSGFAINFVNVVASNSGVGTISIDGVIIPAADYTPIPGSSFSGVAVPVSVGNHSLSGPGPFGLTSYGFASFDSYGYPGGLALGAISDLTDLFITPLSATGPINTQLCVVATTLDQNASPIEGIRVDFVVTGANTNNGFVFTNVQGNGEYCYTGTITGLDTIVASVGNVNATATMEWTDSGGPMLCDADDDGDIDRLDLRVISRARGQVALPNDPRDANQDGMISPSDTKVCIPLCTLAGCAIPVQ